VLAGSAAPRSARCAASSSRDASSPAAPCSRRAPATPAPTASSSTAPRATRRALRGAARGGPRARPRARGLGARDTLRLEAALPLYGQELDADTTPLEAGLDRFVELDRDFLGAAAIRRRRDAGFTRALVGFEVEGRGIARTGYPVLAAGKPSAA
jgi:aminomethyltransferase